MKRCYQIFLSYNFGGGGGDFIRHTAEELSESLKVDVVTASQGHAESPPEVVREKMNSVDGMLAVRKEDTSWVSNEIGMAYALDLPIYLIVQHGDQVEGISKYLTSYRYCDLEKQSDVRLEFEAGLKALTKEIDSRRQDMPE